jgi:cysteinyl-tRNA synthetase
MTREEFESRIGEGIFKTSDQDLIVAAWGKRRASSRNRGMEITAYPKTVAAAKKLWLDWFDRVQAGQPEMVVIAKKKAQARIDAALGQTRGDPEYFEAEPQSKITQEEVNELLAERELLRIERDFHSADKIRDYLAANGVVVSDAKITA